jgi:DNA end-binding protein Ku
MRAIWKGFISFGLVNIPVALYSAIDEQDLHFHQLHKDDGGRIGYDKTCKVCGQVLEQDDIVKGYEVEKGKYVTLTDEDFDKVARAASKSITIQQFVDISSIDPLYYDKSYYLGPEEAGKVPYGLLTEVMRRTGKAGVAKMVMRDKEKLALIRPVGDALSLSTMYFPAEIKKPEGIGLPEGEAQFGEAELNMADMLVKALSGDFKPDQYEDTYRKELLEMIEKKAEGLEYAPTEERVQPTKVIDIVSQLKASIEQAEQAKKEEVKAAI